MKISPTSKHAYNIRLKTSFLRSTQDNKNTRASSRFFLSFVSLEKLCFSQSYIIWRRVGDSNSRARSPQPNDLANRPLQPLG